MPEKKLSEKAQRVCQLIIATEKEKKKCGGCYKTALSLVRTRQEGCTDRF